MLGSHQPAIFLKQVGHNDGIGDSSLVLQTEKDEPFGGAGALACNYTSPNPQIFAIANASKIAGFVDSDRIHALALSLGVVIGGNIVTEIAFNYPGLGNLIFKAISNQDFFLLQGIFIFIVLGVLIANFIIDLVFISVDPRTRLSMQGAAA